MPAYKDKNTKNNPWYFAFEVKDENGKRKTIKKRGFKTKREAEIFEVEARNEWNKGAYYEPIKSTFGEYIYNWIENKQNLSEQAKYNNINHIKHHIIPLIGHVPMSKLNVFVIEKFISDLQQRNLAESTVRKIYNIVNTSLNAAVKKELLPKNPMTLLEAAPRVSKKKLDYWTADEVKQFLNGFEHRQKIVFQLAIYTGMRMGEILGLSLDDIDLENKHIHVRQVLTYDAKLKAGAKTISGNRSISIPESLLDPLEAQIKAMELEIAQNGGEYNKDRLLVCTMTGKPLTKPNLTSTWYYLLKVTKVRKIRFHDLRHTCASLLLQIGVHPKVVQELLGHSSIKVTIDLYSHMTPNMQADAIKALDDYLK